MLTRKHHCRSCGSVFCSHCLTTAVALPELGLHSPARVCDRCAAAYRSARPTILEPSRSANYSSGAFAQSAAYAANTAEERARILASIPPAKLGKARVYCPWLFSTADGEPPSESSDDGEAEADPRQREAGSSDKRKSSKSSQLVNAVRETFSAREAERKRDPAYNPPAEYLAANVETDSEEEAAELRRARRKANARLEGKGSKAKSRKNQKDPFGLASMLERSPVSRRPTEAYGIMQHATRTQHASLVQRIRSRGA